MNAIDWTTKAVKQLRKLDAPQQVLVRNAVGKLEAMPACANVKALVHHEYGYRLRVGNYRVLFNWDHRIRVIEIEEVRKRDERTD